MLRQRIPPITATLTVLLLAVAGALLPTQSASANGGHHRLHVVRPGQSIQAAIEAARPGDTVLVRPGTYRENVHITKNYLTLLGFGARLDAPPAPTTPGGCLPAGQPNTVGICVNGLLDPATGQRVPVRGVTIRGITIGPFASTGLIVLGGRNTRIEKVDAAGGIDYGILFVQSTRTTLRDSAMHGGRTAGLYIGESPEAFATISGNRIFDNGIFGVFVRTASHGTFTNNRVEGSCVGFGFIPTTTAENSVSEWQVSRNHITANNRLCSTAAGQLTGVGVYLGGTKNITVKHNVIQGNTGPAGAHPPWGGGVVVNNGSLFGFPNLPVGNQVVGNTILGNLPSDISVVVAGTDNRFIRNQCETSTPTGLC